jgi:hypothetical protein
MAILNQVREFELSSADPERDLLDFLNDEPRRGFKRPFKFKNRIPSDPTIQRMGDWPECNQEFYGQFYFWLGRGGYAKHTMTCYGTAVRDALGLLDKPYWEIDSADLARVYDYLAARTDSASVRGARKAHSEQMRLNRLQGIRLGVDQNEQ